MKRRAAKADGAYVPTVDFVSFETKRVAVSAVTDYLNQANSDVSNRTILDDIEPMASFLSKAILERVGVLNPAASIRLTRCNRPPLPSEPMLLLVEDRGRTLVCYIHTPSLVRKVKDLVSKADDFTVTKPDATVVSLDQLDFMSFLKSTKREPRPDVFLSQTNKSHLLAIQVVCEHAAKHAYEMVVNDTTNFLKHNSKLFLFKDDSSPFPDHFEMA